MDRMDIPKPEDLSSEEKAGQVLMVGFAGKDPEGAREAVSDLKVGGIIYFARNTGSVSETAEVSAALQRMASDSSGIPLLISVDQEGGVVSRLTEGMPLMPGPMSLGAVGDPELAFEVSRAIGTQIRAAGINMDLAPDLDVNDNPNNPVIGVRSFGSDPSLVENLGVAAVRGFMAAGVAPVGKHFPGHGNTSVDSHLDLPVLPHSMERLSDVELRPFKGAIRAGIPAIMTAHIVFKAIDPGSPATLSEPVLEGLLRRGLEFQGVIMTDCLEMNAISKAPGTARGAVLALKAGADMLLISHTLECQQQAYHDIIEAVKSGQVPVSRLDDAVRRVLALKKALRIPNPLSPEDADSEDLRHLSAEAHRRSITLVKDEAGSMPVRGRVAVVSRFPVGPLAEALSGEEGIRAVELVGTTVPPEELRAANAVILVTQNAWKDPEQLSFAKSVLKEIPRAIVLAARDPYDIRALPEAKTFVCAYSHRPEALRAAAEVLLGKTRAEGNLPVATE